MEDLTHFMHRVVAGEKALTWLHPVRDMKKDEIHIAPEIRRLDILRSELAANPCTSFANLEEEVGIGSCLSLVISISNVWPSHGLKTYKTF